MTKDDTDESAGRCRRPSRRHRVPLTSYDDTLARLVDVAGGASPAADLTPEDFAAVMDRVVATWPGTSR